MQRGEIGEKIKKGEKDKGWCRKGKEERKEKRIEPSTAGINQTHRHSKIIWTIYRDTTLQSYLKMPARPGINHATQDIQF